MSFPQGPIVLEVPEPDEGEENPGNIEPGEYNTGNNTLERSSFWFWCHRRHN